MSRTPLDKSQIDVDVGARIRARRKLLGMSQSNLADELGITFQQVQKYEKGSNRVGSSRLQHIAKILGTTPSALFGEDNGEGTLSKIETSVIDHLVGSADAIALNKAFVRISDPGTRKSLIALIRTLASDQDTDS